MSASRKERHILPLGTGYLGLAAYSLSPASVFAAVVMALVGKDETR